MAISEQFKLLNLKKEREQEDVKMKTNEKKGVLQFDKAYFLNCSLGFPSEDDLYRLRRGFYNILNHSKWRTIEKDLAKCLVIGISTL
jgi:hypothetical protein